MDEASATSTPLRHRALLAFGHSSSNRSPPRSPSRGLVRTRGLQRRTTSAFQNAGFVHGATLLLSFVGLATLQFRILPFFRLNTKDDATRTRGRNQTTFLTSWMLQSNSTVELLRVKRHRIGRASASSKGQDSKRKGPVSARQRKAYPAATKKEVRNKPTIYLDVGPFETGMSSLRCALSGNAYNILKQDNGV